MNKLELMKFRNKVIECVQFLSRKRNCVFFNTHNSWQHELIKARICYRLQKQGMQYITEAKFTKGRGTADILVLDTAQVIEVMKTEEIESVEWKAKKYPEYLEVIAVKNDTDYFVGNYKVISNENEKNMYYL